MITCAKCGWQFDPARQFAACKGRGDPFRHQKCMPVPELDRLRDYTTPVNGQTIKPIQPDFPLSPSLARPQMQPANFYQVKIKKPVRRRILTGQKGILEHDNDHNTSRRKAPATQ
jgi:hypothetical protein